MYNAGSDYEIANSLRFNDGDAANLARTPSSTGNQRTWTWSCWVKRGASGAEIRLFGCYQANDSPISLKFDGNDKLSVDNWAGQMAVTTARFRDKSAWYHIILALDTTQSAAANRAKFYVNGVQQATVAGGAGFPGLNLQAYVNLADQDHRIGTLEPYDGSQYFDGCLAEMHFVDGAALTPSSFGETDDTHGHWKPIDCKDNLTYGTNGFYLDFKSSGVGTASSSTVGADRSGNDNHWTSNALAATDQMIDTPTNNFCTMNQLSPNRSGLTFSEGNLKMAGADTGFFGTMGVSSGKWYYEMHSTNAGGNNLNTSAVGIVHEDALHDTVDSSSNDGFQLFGGVNKARGYYGYAGNKLDEDSNDSYGDAFVTGDVIGVALNLDDREITFYKNNASQGVAFTSLGSGEWFPLWQNWTSSVGVMNFGQDSSFAGVKTAQGNQDGNDIGDFYYAPPSGFLALCTKNFPEPAVIPSEYFNTILYTGDDQTGKSITGVGFQPTFSWIKEMQGTAHHVLHDAARGATAGRISSNRTAVEDATDSMASFNSDGFVVGSSAAYINSNNASIVAWNWKGGGAGSSNTEGSINTTKTSVDTDAGFSIMTYTGNATEGATIGHGLTKAPEVVMTKKRAAAAGGWMVFHIGNTAAPETDELNLEVTEATQDSANIWNDTLPSNTVITIGNNSVINADGATFVAYAWHSVEGFSKFGSYVGTNSTDGAFVYLGFKPALLITKAASRTGHWNMQDCDSNPTNRVNKVLFANSTDAQYTDPNAACLIDFTSNGFKWRNNDDNQNDTGETYIYMAWAETPFKYANAR
jgi:hypothetical protein